MYSLLLHTTQAKPPGDLGSNMHHLTQNQTGAEEWWRPWTISAIPCALTLCSTLFCCALSKWTFMSRLPSSFTRILLPTISLGKTKSSRMASCTAVRVRLLGRFCLFFVRLFRVGLGRILLWAMKTTCFPLNFFSNSRTSRTWIFWKDFSWGTGTKIMMAFRPPPTSIS